jgi:OmpA-OmpF porin, OOP family
VTKIRIISLVPAVASVCLFGTSAMADESGFYIGANVGRVLGTYRRNDINNALISDFGGADGGFALGPSSVEKSHAAWTADIGYMLTRNFGIEASYLNLGSLAYSSFGTQTALDGGASAVAVTLNTKSHGPALALIGVLPMSNIWEVDARVGVYEAKTISTYETTVGENTSRGRLSETSSSTLAGVGTALTLSSHCTLRLDYVRLQRIREKALERAFNVDLLTAGVAFVF